jgi:hypothetical protein
VALGHAGQAAEGNKAVTVLRTDVDSARARNTFVQDNSDVIHAKKLARKKVK